MKSTLLILIIISVSISLHAQDIQEISTGAGYRQQGYIQINSGEQKLSANNTWDIAFAVHSPFAAGLFINESSGTLAGLPEPVIELYDGLSEDFLETPDTALIMDYRLFNPEDSWDFGAFNEYRDPDNSLDYGWGFYNVQTHQVIGTRVYVIKLRDGSLRKMVVESLIGSVYTIRYANLDGTNDHFFSLNKADYTGKTLAYFSFSTGSTVEVEPATGGFDLVFCRYSAPVYDPGSQTEIEYNVTGILSGLNVTVAVANGVDPATVIPDPYLDSMQLALDVIGHDWKTFTGSGWSLDPQRVYFVRLADDHIWKIQFIDFEGSSTGTAVFEKTDLGQLTSVADVQIPKVKTLVYPNPCLHSISLALDLPADFADLVEVYVHDSNGKYVWHQQKYLTAGLQVLEINSEVWVSGTYHVSMQYKGTLTPLSTVVKVE